MPGKIFLFVVFLFSSHVVGQEMDPSDLLEQSVENLLMQAEEEIDITELKEKIAFYSQHPIDLNSAIESDFEKLGFLTCFKIAMILEYRELHGPFITTNELNGVDGLSTNDVQLLQPFVTVTNIEFKQKQIKTLQQFQMVLGSEFPISEGFRADSLGNTKYAGNPIYSRVKYRLHSNKINAGFLAEKDAGEQFNNYGFDFYSAYFEYKGNKNLKNLLVGDYRACFGQGLTLWNGFSGGLNSNIQNIRKLRPGFSGYSSVNENFYLRGMASSLQCGYFTFSPFVSSKKIDASIESSNDSSAFASSLKTSGLHAQATEIRNRKTLAEKNVGGNLSFDYNNFHFGFTSCNTFYDIPIQPDKTIGTQYKFSGNSWNAHSIDYLVKKRKYELFGEWALSSNGGRAFINGIQMQLFSEMYLSLLFRDFDADYHAAYASSFAQNPKTYNEKGIFLGLEISPISKLKITGSADFYENAAPTTRFNDSQQAKEYFLECSYFQNSETSYSVRYTFKNRKEIEENLISGPKISNFQDYHKLRFHAAFKLSESFELKNRLEISLFKKQKGILAYQELVWKPEYRKLSMFFRYTIFETDSWDTRLFAYENNLLNSFSFPAFSGKGIRFFTYLNHSIFYNLKASLQYSQTWYLDRSGIGSNAGYINSSSTNELSCQLLLLF